MFAEAEFLGNFAIAESVGDQSDDLFFARDEEFQPARIHHAK